MRVTKQSSVGPHQLMLEEQKSSMIPGPTQVLSPVKLPAQNTTKGSMSSAQLSAFH